MIARLRHWLRRSESAPTSRVPAGSDTSTADDPVPAALRRLRERGTGDATAFAELEQLHREVQRHARLQGLAVDRPYEPASLIDDHA